TLRQPVATLRCRFPACTAPYQGWGTNGARSQPDESCSNVDRTERDSGSHVRDTQVPTPVPGLRPEPVALRAAACAVAGRRHIDNLLSIRLPQAPSDPRRLMGPARPR